MILKRLLLQNGAEIRIEQKKSLSAAGHLAEDEILLTYKGNGFLYHMVRIITGTLIEVGMHRRKPEELAEILDSGNREMAGELAPAKGLALMEVRYL